MSEETSPAPIAQPKRFDVARLFRFLFGPGRVFGEMAQQHVSFWLAPLLFLSLMLIARTLAHGYFQSQAAALGEVPLPPDWQWWTPEMQNNYMQAQQATQSPAIVYIIPSVLNLMGLWLGWGALGAVAHLVSTLFGGRGSSASALNIVAWASLPFALRDLLKVVFMLIAQRTINNPGLSGFVSATDDMSLFLGQVLANLDIYLVWFLILLGLGFRIFDSLPRGKSFFAALLVVLLSLFTQAGLGLLAIKLSAMMMGSRSF